MSGTANLFSIGESPGARILSHPQVVEDETVVEREFAHHFGAGLSGFLKRLEDAHRKAAQTGDVLRAGAGSDSAAIFIVVPVDDVMNAFDAPMPPVDGQHAFGRGLLRCAARDPQCDLTSLRAGLFVDGFALDHKDLPGMGEVEAGIQRRGAPNTPRLNAAMIRGRDLDEIGGPARLEQQGDIALQRWLVALHPGPAVLALRDVSIHSPAIGGRYQGA